MSQLVAQPVEHLDPMSQVGPLSLHLLPKHPLIGLERIAGLGEMLLLEQVTVLHQRPFLLHLGSSRFLFGNECRSRVRKVPVLLLTHLCQFPSLARFPLGQLRLESPLGPLVLGLHLLQSLLLALPLTLPFVLVPVELLPLGSQLVTDHPLSQLLPQLLAPTGEFQLELFESGRVFGFQLG